MLNLNKNKLIPATEIIAYWGEIKGDISKQTDLVELTTDLDTSIKGWVNEQGYLTEHQALADYTQKSEIEPLYNKYEGYLKYNPGITYLGGMSNAGFTFDNINNNSLKNLVNTIDDKVYAYNPYKDSFFRFNIETFSFDEYFLTSNGTIPTQIYPMWSDSRGRVYYGNKFIFVINDDNKTVDMISQELGGDFQEHTGTIKSNIIKKDGVVYMISFTNACAYIFNEETQSFDSSIPVRGKFPSTTFYRYLSEFEGHWIYDVGKEQTELVFHLDEVEPYAEWVVLPERLFPGAWSYEYEGKTINESTRGVYVHPVVKDGVTEYYNFGYKNPVMYKLVNGAWEIVGYNQTVENMTTYIGGCTCGTLWFGYGYQSGHTGEIIIWNMDDNPVYYFENYPEFYGWYDLDSDIEGIKSNIQDLDSRISALETNYGDALNITNQILG